MYDVTVVYRGKGVDFCGGIATPDKGLWTDVRRPLTLSGGAIYYPYKREEPADPFEPPAIMKKIYLNVKLLASSFDTLSIQAIC